MLESNVLAIDVLSSIDDLEYTSVIQALKEFEYRVCDTLDVKDLSLIHICPGGQSTGRFLADRRGNCQPRQRPGASGFGVYL